MEIIAAKLSCYIYDLSGEIEAGDLLDSWSWKTIPLWHTAQSNFGLLISLCTLWSDLPVMQLTGYADQFFISILARGFERTCRSHMCWQSV